MSAKHDHIPKQRPSLIRTTLFAGAAWVWPLAPGAAGLVPTTAYDSAHAGFDRTHGVAVTQAPARGGNAQSPVPEWARERWEILAKARSLQLSQHTKPNMLSGDFDGDSKPDVALLVEHRVTHKVGIVFVHHTAALPRVVGAGTDFGNGGDNFDWMDSWKMQPRTKTRPTDAVLVERESSASGLIYFANGKYHWKQVGD